MGNACNAGSPQLPNYSICFRGSCIAKWHSKRSSYQPAALLLRSSADVQQPLQRSPLLSWSQVSSWLTSWLFGSSATQQPKQPAHQAGAAGPAKPGHDGWQVIACHAGQLLEDDRIRELARLGRALATVGGHLSSLLVAVQEQPRSPQEPGLNALAVMSGRWPQPKAPAPYSVQG